MGQATLKPSNVRLINIEIMGSHILWRRLEPIKVNANQKPPILVFGKNFQENLNKSAMW